MSSWNRIMECVPNFSEGRDLGKIEKIIEPFRAQARVNCWIIAMMKIIIAWSLL